MNQFVYSVRFVYGFHADKNIGQAVINIIERKEKEFWYMGDAYLRELAEVDIRSVSRETLADIKDVKIDPSLSREEKVFSFIEQVKNPYCVICDGVIVKMNFSREGETLEDRLNSYFLSL